MKSVIKDVKIEEGEELKGRILNIHAKTGSFKTPTKAPTSTELNAKKNIGFDDPFLNPIFEKALCEKINTRISTDELEKELSVFKKELNQLVVSKRKLASQIDNLDVTDKHYDKKYQDMQNRLYSFYDEIEIVEEKIEDLQSRIINIQELQKLILLHVKTMFCILLK